MRYIGNKENIIGTIDQILQKHGVAGRLFYDFFAGTTSVARYFKAKGYRVETSDMLFLSYCMQRAYVENNEEPRFERLPEIVSGEMADNVLFHRKFDGVLHYLNCLPGKEGFIFRNFTPGGTAGLDVPRMYFSDENGKKIDAVRTQIEEWWGGGMLTETEYYVLLTCLLEAVSFRANVAGIYAAFYKKWDPRALKSLNLSAFSVIDNKCENKAHFGNSMESVDAVDTDILYLDPPYNERQYLPNYHVLETIARYDKPEVRGVTGMRGYEGEKSTFCNSTTALRDLDRIARLARYKFLVMSYNSEGIMGMEDVCSVLSKYGSVEVESFDYARYKSNNSGTDRNKRKIKELLFILKRN